MFVQKTPENFTAGRYIARPLTKAIDLEVPRLRSILRERFALGDILSFNKDECLNKAILIDRTPVSFRQIFAFFDIPVPNRWSVSEIPPPYYLAEEVWPELEVIPQEIRQEKWHVMRKLLVWESAFLVGKLGEQFPEPDAFLRALFAMPHGRWGDMVVAEPAPRAEITLRHAVHVLLKRYKPDYQIRATFQPGKELIAEMITLVWVKYSFEDAVALFEREQKAAYRKEIMHAALDPIEFLDTYIGKQGIGHIPMRVVGTVLDLPFSMVAKSALLQLLTSLYPESALVQTLWAYWEDPRLFLTDMQTGEGIARELPPRVVAHMLGKDPNYYGRNPKKLQAYVEHLMTQGIS